VRRALSLFVAGLVCTACVPDLDVKASRVDATRVVAVRATPAEVTPGSSVTWDAVVVTPLPTPSFQIDWAMCTVPRNPADSITVAGACFAPVDLAAMGALVTTLPGATGARAQGAVPSDACRKIGPEVMMSGDMPVRPPDADITGGYQLPLRLQLQDANGGTDTSFDRQRVRCNLAAAPITAAREFAMRYANNVNPVIESISVAGTPPSPADGSARFSVASGARLPLTVNWPAAARETYVLFDPVAREVREKPETLEIAWYTNGGEFERDRTTPDEQDASFSSNELILDRGLTGTITVWIVLRDDRGGVGVATLAFDLS
jgi:hypothetical protein